MAPPKQTETEAQVIAALQGIGQVLQQIAAEVAALRALLEERLEKVPPESKLGRYFMDHCEFCTHAIVTSGTQLDVHFFS